MSARTPFDSAEGALGQIPLHYLGRRQDRSWSQTYSELNFGLSSSSLAAN